MPSLLVINPNTTQAMTDDIGRGARAAAQGYGSAYEAGFDQLWGLG
jgi:Asp/Glu/hydantoin racemase